MAGEPIVLASDHAGFGMKQTLVAKLEQAGHSVIDAGCHSPDSVDYPDMADALAAELKSRPGARGILVCGSGIGISIAANRHHHIRCALCHDVTTAQLCRQHNDANVLALGSRTTGISVAEACVDAFLSTGFDGGRHAGRVNKLGIGG